MLGGRKVILSYTDIVNQAANAEHIQANPPKITPGEPTVEPSPAGPPLTCSMSQDVCKAQHVQSSPISVGSVLDLQALGSWKEPLSWTYTALWQTGYFWLY